jgi:hypothetical protein
MQYGLVHISATIIKQKLFHYQRVESYTSAEHSDQKIKQKNSTTE